MLTIGSASVKLFATCVISSLYYIADGGMTVLIRMVKREKIWEPPLQHFFQKVGLSGKNHRRIVSHIIKCNILLMLFAVNSLYYPTISIISAFIVVIITLISLIS